MNDFPITHIKDAIEESIASLESARNYATEDSEVCEAWKALGETAAKIDAVFKAAKALFPLHPEIEEAVKQESKEMEHLADQADAASW